RARGESRACRERDPRSAPAWSSLGEDSRPKHMNNSLLHLAALLAFSTAALAQAPPSYYASVDTTNASTLRATLHAVIKDHTKIPYTASTTDTWDVLNLANEDPGNTAN